MIQQLRVYEIFEASREAFLARFRDHAARIMRGYGFEIRRMWVARGAGRLEFVYLLDWPDEATMRAAWAGFMADAEWKAIKAATPAEHLPMVGAIEDRVLEGVG